MNAELTRHLTVHSPLLWVNSDEPHRVIAQICTEVHDREILRLDLLDGLVTWKNNKWLKKLVEVGPDEWVPVTDLFDALMYTLRNSSVFILENAHLKAEKLVEFLSHTANRWIDKFYVDNREDLSASFVLISCKDEVPPEIARDTSFIKYTLPVEDEIKALAAFVQARSDVPQPDKPKLLRAASGMTEFELAQALAVSLETKNEIDVDLINHIKLENLKAGGILEMREPSIKLADIGGLDQLKELLLQIQWTYNHPQEAESFGIEPLRRILLVGVQGCGKSAMAEATADALSLELAKFGVGAMMSKWVGESEANIRRAFRQVKAMAPLCLWMDEFGRDMSGGQSSGQVDGGTTDRVHAEFLTGVQELPQNVFLVAAANRIDTLAPELLRADRFDKIIFVGFPTEEEREEIFRIHLGKTAEQFDLPKLARATPFFSGAEIKALIREAKFNIVGLEHRAPVTDDIIAAAPNFKGRVWVTHKEQIIDMYNKAKTSWAWASSAQEAEAMQILKASKPKESLTKASSNLFGSM